MHPRNGFHVLYSTTSTIPITCERLEWKTCPEHKHLNTKRPNVNATKINHKEYDNEETSGNISVNQYQTGFSVESILQEATDRKGKLLTSEEAQAAAVLGQWYEDGELKPHRSLSGEEYPLHVQFSDMKPIKKGNKTIGAVQLGSEGFQYYYEVEGDNVTFKKADNFNIADGKLPWNYSMLKKLDGKNITETNHKWATDAYIGGRGL